MFFLGRLQFYCHPYSRKPLLVNHNKCQEHQPFMMMAVQIPPSTPTLVNYEASLSQQEKFYTNILFVLILTIKQSPVMNKFPITPLLFPNPYHNFPDKFYFYFLLCLPNVCLQINHQQSNIWVSSSETY